MKRRYAVTFEPIQFTDMICEGDETCDTFVPKQVLKTIADIQKENQEEKEEQPQEFNKPIEGLYFFVLKTDVLIKFVSFTYIHTYIHTYQHNKFNF